MANNLSPELKISVARHHAGQKAPYFKGTLLSMVVSPMSDEEVKNAPPGMATMGVTHSGILYFNPEWVDKQSVQDLAGVMVHEGLHLILDSHGRRGTRNHTLWNLATDMVINEIVKQMGLTLPAGCLFPSQFGWPSNEMADWYYDQLIKQTKQAMQAMKASGQGVGSGACGTCAGGDGKEPGDPADGKTPAQMARMRGAQAEAVQQASQDRDAGNVPGELARWANDQLAPPKVPWQAQLARYARQMVTSRRGLRDYTYARISRRQWGVGIDAPRFPSMVDNEIKVAIAIDTSGSMQEEELSRGLAEAQGILQAAGCKVRAIVCDAHVHEDCEVSNAMALRAKLKGGGGTDFRPVFEALTKRSPRPDVLVFFTDGYGPAPDEAPPFGVIWLLIGPGNAPATWGESIKLD